MYSPTAVKKLALFGSNIVLLRAVSKCACVSGICFFLLISFVLVWGLVHSLSASQRRLYFEPSL